MMQVQMPKFAKISSDLSVYRTTAHLINAVLFEMLFIYAYYTLCLTKRPTFNLSLTLSKS